MTTINQAQKLMDQRKIMIAEATEILAILGATQEEMQHKEQVINITINKGKIVAVEKTKEIIIDNTDHATIEMLRETIRRQNEIMNDMNKEYADNSKDDQKRVATPDYAKELGSTYIVVGRAITGAENPVEAYNRCIKEFC